MRIKKSFPEDPLVIGGIRDQENWHYISNELNFTEDSQGWIITTQEIDLIETKPYLSEGRASFMINIPHLAQEEYSNYSIPIDWIKIKVYKPGEFNR